MGNMVYSLLLVMQDLDHDPYMSGTGDEGSLANGLGSGIGLLSGCF